MYFFWPMPVSCETKAPPTPHTFNVFYKRNDSEDIYRTFITATQKIGYLIFVHASLYSHSPHVTAHTWRVGAFLHLTLGLAAAQTQVLLFPLPRRVKFSVVSTQQLVQVFGQASLTPVTHLHLQAVDFLCTHSLQVLNLVQPLSPGLTAEKDSVLSLHVSVGGVGSGVGAGVDAWGAGVGAGVEFPSRAHEVK